MACSHISDAKFGSAPGLEIRKRIDHPSSEGGESVHTVALTTLSSKRLDGIPIAQKVGEKMFHYFDKDGNQLTKQQAMALAGGVAYYPDVQDPSKGRFRCNGAYASENYARTLLTGSRAGSDIANIGDLDGFDGKLLHGVEEEDEEPQQDEAEPAVQTEETGDARLLDEQKEEPRQDKAESVIKTAKTGYAGLLPALSALVLLAAISLPLWQSGRREVALAGSDGRVDSSSTLSPEIAALLKADTTVTVDGGDLLAEALLDMPPPAKDSSSLEERMRRAAAEVDRILAARMESDILGPGPLSHQQKEFQRIVLLLHPDKGLVSASDGRASDALRLAFAARRRSNAKASK